MKKDHQLFHTGIPLIDDQHAQYLNLVDQVFALIQRSHIEQSTVDASLKRVLTYALEHFDAEEALMISTRYPGYEKHRAKHDEFRAKADQLCAMSKEDIAPDDQLIRLEKWLVIWFCEQTLVYDKGIAAFLKKRNCANDQIERDSGKAAMRPHRSGSSEAFDSGD